MAAALTIWRRNSAQFFYSFVTVGLITVCAQDFFARVAPADKERWLAATLLLGTLAAFAGIRAGQRLAVDRRRRRLGLLAAIVGLSALLGALVAPWIYVFVHCVDRWLINLGVQGFDAGAAGRVDARSRRTNDHASTSLRFVGMLAGPITFGAAAGGWALAAAAIVGAGLVAVWSALALDEDVDTRGRREGGALKSNHAGSDEAAGKRSTDEVAGAGRVSNEVAATGRASNEVATSPPRLRLLIAAALACWAGNYLLATSVVYLVADVYAIAEPVAHAGRLMTAVYASTVAVSLTIAARGLRVGAGWIAAGALCLLLTGLGLAGELAREAAVQYGVGLLLGGTFALCLLAVREAVSRAVEAGHPGALAAFNNLGNSSALVAFSLMVALVELGKALAIPFVTVIAGGLVALALLGLVALALALASGRRRRSASAVS